MSRNILKSSLDNAKFSIIFQIIFRCVTFILNAFIIRHVGQDVLGIMNVRLLLLESTLIFLSREPLLKACLSDTKSHNWAQVLNQIWLSVPISAFLGVILSYVWINLLSSTEEKYVEQYQIGCYAIALSCVIDQVTHSVILVAQSFCFIRIKVMFETFYIIIRTTTFVTLVLRYPQFAINAFSTAQMISSIALCLLYFGFFYWYIKKLNELRIKEINGDETARIELTAKNSGSIFADMQDFRFTSILDFFPGFMKNKESFLNKRLCILTASFAKQSVVKQILTEGERYVMTISPVLTFSQQSMYDIVNNLGSLAARFIFRPIEESSYFYFTQMVKRDTLLINQNKENIIESSTVLSQLLQVVTSIGLVVVVFGHNYSHSLLYLYGGNVLTENYLPTLLLKWHCFAVLLLAVNGITECYVFATMDNKQLDRYNYVMVLFSIMFLLISYVLTNYLGPVGFILANCVNMSARIIHSINFINNQFKSLPKMKPLEGLQPNIKFLIALTISFIGTKASEMYLFEKSILLHIAIGGVFFVCTLLIWAYDNRILLRQGMEKYRRNSLKTE